MPKVRVNDIEMYYEIHGKGTPLVHIGGLAGDARTWIRQIEHLSQHFQVLCFDNRGTGRTDCPDRPYSTKLFADDTVGLMDAASRWAVESCRKLRSIIPTGPSAS